MDDHCPPNGELKSPDTLNTNRYLECAAGVITAGMGINPSYKVAGGTLVSMVCNQFVTGDAHSSSIPSDPTFCYLMGPKIIVPCHSGRKKFLTLEEFGYFLLHFILII